MLTCVWVHKFKIKRTTAAVTANPNLAATITTAAVTANLNLAAAITTSAVTANPNLAATITTDVETKIFMEASHSSWSAQMQASTLAWKQMRIFSLMFVWVQDATH